MYQNQVGHQKGRCSRLLQQTLNVRRQGSRSGFDVGSATKRGYNEHSGRAVGILEITSADNLSALCVQR